MKYALTILMAVSFQPSLAASVSIQPGETVSVLASVDSTVSCSGSGGGFDEDCRRATRVLKEGLETCLENYRGSYEKTSVCIPKVWPHFKAEKSSCLFEGRQICFSTCLNYYHGSYEKTSACENACK